MIARNKEHSDNLKGFLDIKLDDIAIKVVDEFKYVGSRVTGDCTNTKEIKMRRGMMEAWDRFLRGANNRSLAEVKL